MIDSDAVGTLNLCSRRAHGLTAQDQARANSSPTRPRARSRSPGGWRSASRSPDMTKALTSRSVIDQAVGVVIGRTGRDAEDAFGMLRAQSQDTNKKLRDLAVEIVEQASSRAR
jgi:hypothetical protein